jgi:hypothetical protein
MSSMTNLVGNSAIDASAKDPATGYTLNSLCYLMFMLITVINMNT